MYVCRSRTPDKIVTTPNPELIGRSTASISINELPQHAQFHSQINENMNVPYNDIPAIGNIKDQGQSTSFHSNNNKGNAHITLRYTQLLFNPVTNAVTAAEVEQTQRGDLWADESDALFNGRSMTRKHRRSSQPTIDEIIVPNYSFTSSSSSCASSYSSLSSDESHGSGEEMSEVELPWEELIHDLALDLASNKSNNDGWAFRKSGDERSACMNKGEIMPFVMSELPLAFDSEWIDEDDEPIGLALLEDNSVYSGYEVSSTTVAFHQKRSCRPKADIRWKQLGQRIADTFDRDDMARIFLFVLSSGNPGAWCESHFHSRREKTANAYESL